MTIHKVDKKDYFILTAILFIALLFRLYRIDAPLGDFHSWRQADTAAVARNFERNGINLLKPQYDDLSNLQSGIDNPQGYRFVEFPIYNAIIAAAHSLLPVFSLETWGRLIASLFSLICIASIYYLTRSEVSRVAAIFASLTYAIMPFFVYFSRVILPETPAISTAIAAIALLHMFIMEAQTGKKILLLLASSIVFALSLLIKPTTIFYGLPIFLLFLRTYKFGIPKKIHVIFYFILAAIPLLAWRYYITNFPEGIPASDWLISRVNTYEGQKEIFMRPAFFRWIFFERLNNLILGGYLTALFVLGLLRKHRSFFLISIPVASFIYIFTFQGGNVQHAYYQTIAFPGIAIAVGMGAAALIESSVFLNPIVNTFAVLILFAFSFLFSYYQVKDYYQVPQDLLQMANIIKTFSRQEDKVVADRMGDTTLLYLSDRKGSPLLYREPEEFKAMGYKYVLADKAEIIEKLKLKSYAVLFENSQFALFAL
jgi:hypothetical protein